MSKCVVCGSKAKEQRIGLDYCKICSINFDNRLQLLNNSEDEEMLEKNFSKVIEAINTRDNYNDENREKVIKYFKNAYDEKINEKKDKEMSGILYEIKGARGRSLEVYKNKIVINTKVTVGSIVTGNVNDGKKTIYFSDVIGLQFKASGALLGYIQLETASSTMNNEKNNFFNENTFTFDESTVSNKKMIEIYEYIDRRLEQIKFFSKNSADEIRKYKSLLDDNIISLEEFKAKKKQLLNL